MIFKVFLNQQVYRIRGKVTRFQDLTEMVKARFADQIPQYFSIEYQDQDDDKVRINCEEDFAILLEEFEGAKSVKLYIKEDLSQSMQSNSLQVFSKDSSIEVIKEDSVEEINVIVKEDLLQVEKIPEQKKEEPIQEEESEQPEQPAVDDLLALAKWSEWLDVYTTEDNPNEILWKLKKCVQERINIIKHEFNIYYERTIWRDLKDECKQTAEDAMSKDLPEEVCFDDIKSYLLSLEGCKEVKPWITFKMYIQQKIRETREVVKSDPKRCERFFASKKEGNEKYDWRQHVRGGRRHHGERKHYGERKHHGGYRGGHHGGKWKEIWAKKKEWFNNKFQKKFDESIREAIPQIAVHVAQILGKKDSAEVPVKVLAPMKCQEMNVGKDQVVHKGYVCDGCGTSPIMGACYKCSVCKDFDFCSKCEDTIPHPHPFLKLKHPSQRPHALFTIINEEGEQPFIPGQDSAETLVKQGKQFIKSFMGDYKKKEKQKKKQEKKEQKKIEKQEKKEQKKEMKKWKKLQKRQEKEEKKLEKKKLKALEKAEKNKKKQSKQDVDTLNCQNLMQIFCLDSKKSDVLLTWVIKQSTQDVQRLADKFLSQDMLSKLFSETPSQDEIDSDDIQTQTGEEINETPQEVEEEEATLYIPKCEEATFYIPKEVPVVKVEPVDPIALANANQLCEIFSIVESQKKQVYEWVVAQKNNNIEELVNAYLEIQQHF